MITRNNISFILFISLLSMLYLWASDMYLPAFNDMALSLDTSPTDPLWQDS